MTYMIHETYLAPEGWGHNGVAYPPGCTIAISTEARLGAVYVEPEALGAAIAAGELIPEELLAKSAAAKVVVPSGTGFGQEF